MLIILNMDKNKRWRPALDRSWKKKGDDNDAEILYLITELIYLFGLKKRNPNTDNTRRKITCKKKIRPSNEIRAINISLHYNLPFFSLYTTESCRVIFVISIFHINKINNKDIKS